MIPAARRCMRQQYWGYFSLFITPLFFGGCFDSDRLPKDAKITCRISLDCPSKSGCIDGLCYEVANECILQGQDSPSFAPPGTPCSNPGEGICLRGQCIIPACGDGIVTPPESCDSTPDCRSDCSMCGDGIVNEDNGEFCDDGPQNSDDRPGACRLNCSSSFCGDGIQDPGEGCDNGAGNNDDMPDACRSDCRRASCGDGIVDATESCDNGPGNSDLVADACRERCTAATCGDGVIDTFEECDDGKFNSDVQPVSCRTNCRSYRCGDGVIDIGEDCDRGEENSDTDPGACRSDCRLAFCGDGTIDPGEQCDRGEQNSDSEAGACRMDCQHAFCGDGVVDPGEDCDDGPFNSDYIPGSCRESCQLPSCGDDVRDQGEECDTGEDRSDLVADACRSNCRIAHCGDGIVDETEECDSGDALSDLTPDACRTACILPRCGDGTLDPGNAEHCDTGIANSDVIPDACRTDCRQSSCGDGVRDRAEECDNGTLNSDTTPDACRMDCTRPTCGDGTVDDNEDCDDGNNSSGDGCRADCSKVEVCGDRLIDDGEECDDGNINEWDGCNNSCRQSEWSATLSIWRAPVTSNSPLKVPHHIDVDIDGSVLIAEERGNVIRRWRAGLLELVAGNGTETYTGDTYPATIAGIPSPLGITVSDDGRIAILDRENDVIRLIDQNGIISRIAGQAGFIGNPQDGAFAISSAIVNPYTAEYDARGRLWFFGDRELVRETSLGRRIWRIEEDGTMTHVMGNGVDGIDTGGVQAKSARIMCVGGLARDDIRDRLFITSTCYHIVVMIQSDGSVVTVAGTMGLPGDSDATIVDGAYSPSQLRSPAGVDVVESTGHIFIAEKDGHRIRKVMVPEGLLQTETDGSPKPWPVDRGPLCDATGVCRAASSLVVAGTGSEGDDPDGPSLNVSIRRPLGVAAAKDGTIFFVDGGNRKVRHLEGDGRLVTIAGTSSPGTSPGQYRTDENALLGFRTAALNPTDLNRRIVMAEPEESRVVRLEEDKNTTTLAGNGNDTFSGDCGLAVHAGIGPIRQIAYDDAGRLYLADSTNARVRRVDLDGTIETVLGTGVPGISEETEASGKRANEINITQPEGLSLARVNGELRLYVSDAAQHRILQVTWPEGENSTSCDDLGMGTLGTGHVSFVAGTGAPGKGSEGATASTSPIENVISLASRNNGTIYFVEYSYIDDSTGQQVGNSRVREISPNGITTTVVGSGINPTGGTDSCTKTPAPALSDLRKPYQIGLRDDPDTNTLILYVGEWGCGRILAVDLNQESREMTTFAGRWTGDAISGDGGPAEQASIRYASSIFAHGDDLFFFDYFSRNERKAYPNYLRRVGKDRTITTVAGYLHAPMIGGYGVGRLVDGRQLALLPDGHLLAAAGGTGVLALVDPSGGAVTEVIGYPEEFQPNGGDEASFFAFGEPSGLALSRDEQSMFVTDGSGGRLLELDLTGGAEGGILPPQHWTVRELTSPGDLLVPRQVAIDPRSGDIYIADAGAHCIRRLELSVDRPFTMVALHEAVGSCGSLGFRPERTSPSDARLYGPEAVIVDSDGTLYVSDTGNHRVLAIRDEMTHTLIGTGIQSNDGTGIPASSQSVLSPKGLWLDGKGNLYVAAANSLRMVADHDGDGIPEGSDLAMTAYADDTATSGMACFETLLGLAPDSSSDLFLALDACNGSVLSLRPPSAP